MKKFVFILWALSLCLVSACNYFSDIESRLGELERAQAGLTRSLDDLKSIVTAISEGDYITHFEETVDADGRKGYTLSFYRHAPISIYTGKDGANGADAGSGSTAQSIGIRQDTADGDWYWTLGTEWLLDTDGHRVRANGKDGANGTDGHDGATPEIGIRQDTDGDWYWTLGGAWLLDQNDGKVRANGRDGAGGGSSSGGSSLFSSVVVSQDGEYVTLYLTGGGSFVVPAHPSITITLDAENLEAPIAAGETIRIAYTLTGADAKTQVTASSDGNYKVSVEKTSVSEGHIVVTAPYTYTDGYINFLVSDGRGYTFFRVINFYERGLSVSGVSTTFGGGAASGGAALACEFSKATEGGGLEVPLSVNFNYSVQTSAAWIHYEGITTKAGARNETLRFSVEKNQTDLPRTGYVYVYPANSTIPYLKIAINQASAYFSISRRLFVAEAGGGECTVDIQTSKGVSVSAPSGTSWLSYTLQSSDAKNYTLTLKAAENITAERRSAKLTLYSDAGQQLTSIDCVQYSSVEDDRAAMIITVRANFANDFTVALPVIWTTDNTAIIDWGDGTYDSYSSDKKGKMARHTYTGLEEGKSFDVKISGHVPKLYQDSMTTDLERAAIIAVKQWGKLGVTSCSGAFNGCYNLSYIPGDEDYSFVSVTSFNEAFQSCYGLTSLPENLFANCPNVTSFSGVFSNCYGLTSLPVNLFANCPSVTSFQSAFFDCDGLTSLPENLFANCPAVTSFAYAFYDCNGLTSLPENLFANLPAETSFYHAFYHCDGLTSLPENLFANCPNVTSFQSAFSQCDGLTSLPENLFANCPAVTSFRGTFNGCDGLTSLPENLFANCPAVTSFESAFSHCDGLTSLPENLFANCPAVTSFAYAFSVCDGLTSLPENLFANCPNVTSFNSAFSSCKGLTSLPKGLFDHNRKADFQLTFSACSNLTGESPHTVISDEIDIHLYERKNFPDYFHEPSGSGCFSGCSKLSDYSSIPSGWK